MFKNKKSYLIPIIGFALIIFVATFFLYLPICNYKEISFKDAFFMATSGITTTGFVKMPIVTQFNFFGQFVLAILMEIGAMGFIIFISYFWSIKDKKMKMSDILVINENISGDNFGSIKQYSIFICKIMLEVQTLGAILLALKFIPMFGILKGIWYSIFHSISAFSNTGFDLFGSNSLVLFANDIYIQFVFTLLMILGSIGILVIEDLKNNKSFNKLKLQSKIILTYSLVFLLIPMFIIKILEPNATMLNSLFTSAATRSAGFSIINTETLCLESKILIMILMFIGGAPTSTSGGVRIVTIAIIISTIIATIKGENETVIFWRKIPEATIKKAFTIFMLFILILILTVVIFSHYNNIGLLNICFESLAALSNAGLSITDFSNLNIIGEMILVVLMFIGRVGPLSMILVFIYGTRKDEYIDYPSENVML